MRWLRLVPMAVLAAAALVVLATPADADEYWIAPTPFTECNNFPGTLDTTVAFVNTDNVAHTVTIERADGWTNTLTVAPLDDAIFHVPGCHGNSLGHRMEAPPEIVMSYFHDYFGTDTPDSGHMVEAQELGRVHLTIRPGPDGVSAQFPEVLVVAPSDATVVTLTNAAGTTSTVMDRFDTWYVAAPLGSSLVADKPVAVYISKPADGDFLTSPLRPVEYAGHEYVACNPDGFRPIDPAAPPGDVLRIVPLTGPTHVDIDPPPPGVPAAGLDIAGRFQDIPFPYHLHLKADAPVLVLQVTEKSMDSAGEVLIPVDRWGRNGATHPPPSYATAGGPATTNTWTQHYIQIASPVGATAQVDGVAISNWSPVGLSDFRCGWSTIAVGQPHFASATQASQFIAYGYGDGGMRDIGYMHPMYSGCKPSVVPDAPTGLSGSATAGAVSLSWTLPAADGGCPVLEQRVYRSLGGVPTGPPIQVLPATATSTGDTIAVACPPYRYHVTAVSIVGEGAPSNEAAVFHRDVPSAPQGSAKMDDVGLVLTWNEPASGGCPIVRYDVYEAGQHVDSTTDPRWLLTGVDVCRPYQFTVTATSVVGESPPSAPMRYSPGFLQECQPPPVPVTEYTEDADGDGAPDENDACPAESASGGCPSPGAQPTRLGPGSMRCTDDDLRPRHAAAAVVDASVRITWEPPPACAISHFLVWNATVLVATIPFEADRWLYIAWDEEPWHEEHAYHVQTEVLAGPPVFAAERAVATNSVQIRSCEECQANADLTPADEEEPGKLADIRSYDMHGSFPWLLILILGVAFFAVWHLLRHPVAWRQFTRLTKRRIEEHPVRAQILDAVRADQGIHGRAIAFRIGQPWSTTRYHLRVLVNGRLLEGRRVGRQFHYTTPDTSPAVIVRSRSARRILRSLATHPRANISDVARLTGLSPTAVDYQLRRLEDMGLVRVDRSHQGSRITLHEQTRDAT